MSSQTILYIITAGIIAIILAVFMYGYKTNYSSKNKWIYGSLRFIALFSVLLLLINPTFISETYTIVKPNLPVLVDNSASVLELKQVDAVTKFVESIKNNKALNEKFDISFYSFGNDFKIHDSLTFNENNTNISEALIATNELFKNEVAPTLLITDGNQTYGRDYEFVSLINKNPIYPIILGDNKKHVDLKIEELNTNRYVFLKNKFPVEVILNYTNDAAITTQFVVKKGGSVVYKETVSFSEASTTKIITFTLPALKVGIQKYTAQIIALKDENNIINNSKQFAVEVIDQATNVLIISDIVHPDIGMFKKSITSNEQRKVSIKKPLDAYKVLNDYQLVILYQPNRSFENVYEEIKKLNKNTFTITGLQTDWGFLNKVQDKFRKDVTNQTEDVGGLLNLLYSNFKVEAIGFDTFKPLKTKFGELEMISVNEILLYQSIFDYTNNSPLLATTDIQGKRDAIFDAEGLWKWRAHSFLERNSFEEFDAFIGSLIQYLASNKQKSRLEVSYDNFYYSNKPIRISAQYFDKNYVFDARANLYISIVNIETNIKTEYPLLLKNNFYELNLNTLLTGEYSFVVKVKDEAVARSGNFTIIDFNVEQQFLNADVTKLTRVATNTNGKAFFVSEKDSLFKELLEDSSYQQIQKSEEKITPLIDWKYLLGIIILTLSLEWFLRKYNGLI